MAQHDLKTWPEYFAKLRDWTKAFEIRKNDRDYRVGDVLRLREWNPATESYTGEQELRVVCSIIDGPKFGIEAGYVVMGLQPGDGQSLNDLIDARYKADGNSWQREGSPVNGAT